jgi:hypothetical protein
MAVMCLPNTAKPNSNRLVEDAKFHVEFEAAHRIKGRLHYGFYTSSPNLFNGYGNRVEGGCFQFIDSANHELKRMRSSVEFVIIQTDRSGRMLLEANAEFLSDETRYRRDLIAALVELQQMGVEVVSAKYADSQNDLRSKAPTPGKVTSGIYGRFLRAPWIDDGV